MSPDTDESLLALPHLTVTFYPNYLPQGEVNLSDLANFVIALQSITVAVVQFNGGISNPNAPEIQPFRYALVVTHSTDPTALLYPILDPLAWQLYLHREQIGDAAKMVANLLSTYGGPLVTLLEVGKYGKSLTNRILGHRGSSEAEILSTLNEVRGDMHAYGNQMQTIEGRIANVERGLADAVAVQQQLAQSRMPDLNPELVEQIAPSVTLLATIGGDARYSPDGVTVAANGPNIDQRELAVRYNQQAEQNVKNNLEYVRHIRVAGAPEVGTISGTISAMNKSRHTFTVKVKGKRREYTLKLWCSATILCMIRPLKTSLRTCL